MADLACAGRRYPHHGKAVMTAVTLTGVSGVGYIEQTSGSNSAEDCGLANSLLFKTFHNLRGLRGLLST